MSLSWNWNFSWFFSRNVIRIVHITWSIQFGVCWSGFYDKHINCPVPTSTEFLRCFHQLLFVVFRNAAVTILRGKICFVSWIDGWRWFKHALSASAVSVATDWVMFFYSWTAWGEAIAWRISCWTESGAASRGLRLLFPGSCLSFFVVTYVLLSCVLSLLCFCLLTYFPFIFASIIFVIIFQVRYMFLLR